MIYTVWCHWSRKEWVRLSKQRKSFRHAAIRSKTVVDEELDNVPLTLGTSVVNSQTVSSLVDELRSEVGSLRVESLHRLNLVAGGAVVTTEGQVTLTGQHKDWASEVGSVCGDGGQTEEATKRDGVTTSVGYIEGALGIVGWPEEVLNDRGVRASGEPDTRLCCEGVGQSTGSRLEGGTEEELNDAVSGGGVSGQDGTVEELRCHCSESLDLDGTVGVSDTNNPVEGSAVDEGSVTSSLEDTGQNGDLSSSLRLIETVRRGAAATGTQSVVDEDVIAGRGSLVDERVLGGVAEIPVLRVEADTVHGSDQRRVVLLASDGRAVSGVDRVAVGVEVGAIDILRHVVLLEVGVAKDLTGNVGLVAVLLTQIAIETDVLSIDRDLNLENSAVGIAEAVGPNRGVVLGRGKVGNAVRDERCYTARRGLGRCRDEDVRRRA